MRTPPADLDAHDLTELVAEQWALGDVTLTYAPVGFGSHHWHAAVADGPDRFVTVDRDRPGLAAAFRTALELSEQARLPFVVAPARSVDDDVVEPCGDRVVSVTPFLPAIRDWPDPRGASAADREAVVTLVAALHGATDIVLDEAWLDDLAIEARAKLEAALADLDAPWTGGLYAEGVRGRLRAAAPGVRAGLAAYDDLVERVRARRAPFVVTHGEVKPGNLLATPQGPALVDWDTALLAPPERDLWRLVDADPAAAQRYTALTGRAVDPDALALYRRRWDLTDIALYVDALRSAPARTADTDIAWEALRILLRRAGG